MKKVGAIVFIIAIALGVGIANFFSVGRVHKSFLNFSLHSGTAGSGNLASEPREPGSFNGVDVSGVFQVEIALGKEFGIEVEADDNLLPLIKTEVRDGILNIESDSRISSGNPMRVKISAPDLENVESSGASKVSVSGLNNSLFKIETSGASKVRIEGETANLTIDVSGASHVDAENLKTENATVGASGASHVSVFVSGRLTAESSGASKIVYAGNPKNVEKNSSGAASVREK